MTTDIPAYRPRTGSVADRALIYLAAHGKTSHDDLALHCETDSNGLYGCLALAEKRGFLARDRFNGTTRWFLGDAAVAGAGDEPADPDDVDHAPVTQRTVPASTAPRLPAVEALVAAARAPAGPRQVRQARQLRHVSPPAESADFDCAMFMDGRLSIELGGVRVAMLTPEQTGLLSRYLYRMVSAE